MLVVIALPQRGQEDDAPAQVVPQLEQVEQVELRQPRFVMQPLWQFVQEDHVVLPFDAVFTAAVPFAHSQPLIVVNAADCCGNSGREKNSSHTFSANSSQGGISQ